MIDLAIIHRICQENLVKAVKGETEAEKVWWQHYNVQYHVLDGPRYLQNVCVWKRMFSLHFSDRIPMEASLCLPYGTWY